jgi:hypothetical protein
VRERSEAGRLHAVMSAMEVLTSLPVLRVYSGLAVHLRTGLPQTANLFR